ncbi:hypothetical protein SNEBB_006444 [Seison nebaliae]|nr:hypothetical protein SNEBB_006444 [Seison nebaliae]
MLANDSLQSLVNAESIGELIVECDYEAEEVGELSIKKDERLQLIDDSQVWYLVRRYPLENVNINKLNEVIGIVPSNYVRQMTKSSLFNKLKNLTFSTGRKSSQTSTKPSTIDFDEDQTDNLNKSHPTKESNEKAIGDILSLCDKKRSRDSTNILSLISSNDGNDDGNSTSKTISRRSFGLRKNLATKQRSCSNGQLQRLMTSTTMPCTTATTPADASTVYDTKSSLPSSTVNDSDNLLRELMAAAQEKGMLAKINPNPQAVVQYRYEAKKSDELTLSKGDRVEVLQEAKDGWWKVKCIQTGLIGYYPSTHFSDVTIPVIKSDTLRKPRERSLDSYLLTSAENDHGQNDQSNDIDNTQNNITQLPKISSSSIPTTNISMMRNSNDISTSSPSVPTTLPSSTIHNYLNTSSSAQINESTAQEKRNSESKNQPKISFSPTPQKQFQSSPFLLNTMNENKKDEIIDMKDDAGELKQIHDYLNCNRMDNNGDAVHTSSKVCTLQNMHTSPNIYHHYDNDNETFQKLKNIETDLRNTSVQSYMNEPVQNNIINSPTHPSERLYHPNSLMTKPWYLGEAARDQVDALLLQYGTPGQFCVRKSETHHGAFTLTVLAPDSSARHFCIQQQESIHNDGTMIYRVGKAKREFPDFDSLIYYYTVRAPIFANNIFGRLYLTEPFTQWPKHIKS